MGKRIAATVALVALLSVLLVRSVAVLTDSALFIGLAIVVAMAGAAATGLVVSARVTAAFESLLRRDHAVAVAASHELRTPITALRLSLEDLTLWHTTPPEVADELYRAIQELDRLSDAVTNLLDEHREDHRSDATEVDLAALTSAAVEHWRSTVSTSRDVTVKVEGPAPVRLDAKAVERVLCALLAEFGTADAGNVNVTVARLRQTVRIRVCGQNETRFAPGVIHGPATGKNGNEALTIHEAGGVAESLGGYLAVEESATTCISLILPSPGVHAAL